MERHSPSARAFTLRGVVSPFVGREAELAALDRALADTQSVGIPHVVTLIGNQGTGKSRLVEEWASAVAAPVRLVRGRATRALRYSAIARLLRDRFGLGDEDTEAAREKFSTEVRTVFSDRRVGEMVHFLGSFLGFRYADSPFLRAFDDRPRQHDEVARAVLRRFLEVDAATSPLVLVIDDVDRADDDTLALLEEMAEGLGGSPVVLVLLARPELVVRRPQLAQAQREGHVARTHIELKNFERMQAAGFFRELLARCREVPMDLVDDAVEMTGGNPFFLEELVRVFLESGTIDASDDTAWRIDARKAAQIELPISVEEAIAARIASLEPGERDLLEKGATFGNVFWLGAVVGITRMDKALAERSASVSSGHAPKTPPPPPTGWIDDGVRAALRKRIDKLVDRDYLLVLPPEDSTFSGDVEVVFKHNLERELVARSTDPERARRYHRMAAQWLEARLTQRGAESSGLTEEQLEFLAQLYERGGDQRRAAHCLIASGDRARARFANETAVDSYTRGLRLLEFDDALARADALHNLGDVLARVGRTDEALMCFQDMLRTAWLLDHRSKAGAAQGRIGRIRRQRAEYDRALEHFSRAYQLFEGAGDRRGVAGVLDDVGKVHWLCGAYPTALDHHLRALTIRRELGDARSIALSLANVGRVHHDSGAFAEAATCFREALEVRQKIGDRLGVVTSLVDLGASLAAEGKHDAARERYGEALKLARESGDRLGQAQVLLRQGELALDEDKFRDAESTLTQAHEIVKALGDRAGEAEAARRLAELCLKTGDAVRAYDHARRGLELARKVGARVNVAIAERVIGEVVARTASSEEHWRRAAEHLASAVQLLEEVGSRLELMRAFRALAQVRERAGKTAEAFDLRRRADEIMARLKAAGDATG